MQDILKSFQTQIQERLASPLIGSFLVAWCIWNYKFLVILFSKNTALETFSLINKISFPTIQSQILDGFLIPLAWTMVYIFIYPYPAKFVYKFWRQAQREISKIRISIEDETPLSLAESREIRDELRAANAKVFNLQNEFSAVLKDKDAEIKRLNNYEEAGDSLATPTVVKAIVPDLPHNTLNELQVELLLGVGKRNRQAFHKELVNFSSESDVKTEFNLDELISKGMLTKNYDMGHRDYLYKYTHEGRRYLVDHNLDPK